MKRAILVVGILMIGLASCKKRKQCETSQKNLNIAHAKYDEAISMAYQNGSVSANELKNINTCVERVDKYQKEVEQNCH